MGIGKRIKEARERLGMTQNELADLVGVTGSAITNYEKETSHPKEPIMYKLFSALQVDANYLFQDVVSVPKKVNDVTFAEFEHIKKYRNLDDHGKEMVDIVLEKEYDRCMVAPAQLHTGRIIQYYQRLASAGNGQFVFDDLPADLIEIPDVPKYKDVKYAVGVNGDSMEPLYQDGDVLLVKPAKDVSLGKIGIFLVDGQSYVKKRGKDKLISVNKAYDDIPFTEDSECLGEVVDRLDRSSISREKE